MLNKWYAVIVAGGSGRRFGGSLPKQFLTLGDKPVLQWSVDAFCASDGLEQLVIVSHGDWIQTTQKIVERSSFKDIITVVKGGRTRQDSCRLGLQALPFSEDMPVLIHDAARPWIQRDTIRRVLNAVRGGHCVIPALTATDSLVVFDEGIVQEYPQREKIGHVQTPQGFPLGVILRIHNDAAEGHSEATDDGSLALEAGYPVLIVTGQPTNRKVTLKEDLTDS